MLPITETPSNLTLSQKYNLGDPTDPAVTLGPVVSVASAERILKQVADASESKGSLLRILLTSSAFTSGCRSEKAHS